MAKLFEVPAGEPSALVAGDVWTWSRDDLAGDYPPGLFRLSYAMTPEAGGAPIAIEAAAAADRHLVEVPAATTAAIAAGSFRLAASLTRLSDGRRVSLCAAAVVVRPDPATSSADTRSEARRILDAIEARLAGRADRDVESYTIEGRSLSRTPIPDLLRLRNVYRAKVRAEQGGGMMTTRLVRFR